MKVFQCWQWLILQSLCFSFWMDFSVAKKAKVSKNLDFSCEYPCECDKRYGNPVCASNYETFPNQCFLDLYNYDETDDKDYQLQKIYDGPCTTAGKPALENPAYQDVYDQYEEVDDSEDYEDEYGPVDVQQKYPEEIFEELQRPSKASYPPKNDYVQPVQPVPQVQVVQAYQPVQPPVLYVQPNPYPLYPVVAAPVPIEYQQVPLPAPESPVGSQPTAPEISVSAPVQPPVQGPPLIPLGYPGIVIPPATYSPSTYPPTTNNMSTDSPVASNYSNYPSNTDKPTEAKPIHKESAYPQPPVQQHSKYNSDTKPVQNPTVAEANAKENVNYNKSVALVYQVETTTVKDVPMTHPPVESGTFVPNHQANYPASSLAPVPAPGYKVSTKRPSSAYPSSKGSPEPSTIIPPAVFQPEPSTMIPSAVVKTTKAPYKNPTEPKTHSSLPESHPKPEPKSEPPVSTKENPSRPHPYATSSPPVQSQSQPLASSAPQKNYSPSPSTPKTEPNSNPHPIQSYKNSPAAPPVQSPSHSPASSKYPASK